PTRCGGVTQALTVINIGADKPLQRRVSPALVVPAHDPALELHCGHATIAKPDRVSLPIFTIQAGTARECLKGLFQRSIEALDEGFFMRMASFAMSDINTQSRKLTCALTPCLGSVIHH